MRRQEGLRTYVTKKDVNLKRLESKQVIKIKKQRAEFRKIKARQIARAKELTEQQEGRLQKKLTTRQLRRQEKHIKRNIAKIKKLKYQQQAGDIALDKTITGEEPWYTNFASSNVWKFKIRNNNLLVAFLDGSIYIYFGAGNLYLGMTRAGSKGKYVWRQLRDKFPYVKIR